MPRSLSQLVYSNIQKGSDPTVVITMHDHNQFGPNAAHLGTTVAPNGEVIALESYKGVFKGKDIVGYTWFLGPNTAPSPIFFGDSLQEIERFLWDYIDRSPSENPVLPHIIGEGQGGIMALATALAVPDLVSGVIAVDAFLPIVGGWDPPLAPMNDLPIHLVNPVCTEKQRVLEGDKLQQQLTIWGSRVTVSKPIEVRSSSDTLAAWVTANGYRTYQEVD